MSSLCLFSPILDTSMFLFNSFSQVPLLCLNVTTIFCLEFVSLEVINYSLATKFIQLCLIQDLTCYAIFTMMSWDVIIYSCYHDFVVLWGGLPPLVLHFAIAILIMSKFSECHPMIYIILALERLTEDVALSIDHIKEMFDLHHN